MPLAALLDGAHQIFTARAYEGVELLVLGDDLGSFANLEQHLAQMIGNLRAAMARPSGDDPTASG